MPLVKIKIDGQSVEVEEGSYVLEAARSLGVDIPTLCYYPYMTPYAACRICCVEARAGNGWNKIVTACNYPAWDGLEIWTDRPIWKCLWRIAPRLRSSRIWENSWGLRSRDGEPAIIPVYSVDSVSAFVMKWLERMLSLLLIADRSAMFRHLSLWTPMPAYSAGHAQNCVRPAT
jgi:hypothetical protein